MLYPKSKKTSKARLLVTLLYVGTEVSPKFEHKTNLVIFLFLFCSKFAEIECLYLNLVVGGVLMTGQDGDVALLQPVVHHEVVVPDADGPQGLQQGSGWEI